MTKEEYEEIVSKVYSEDILESIKASFILKLFPTREPEYDANEGTVDAWSDMLRKTIEEKVF